jgi:hydrogenase assembly chaperone HypC/HupF
MCFTIPGKIESVKEGVAKIGGEEIDLCLVSNAKAGDWILHNRGRAIKKISKKDAETLMKIIS